MWTTGVNTEMFMDLNPSRKIELYQDKKFIK